MDPLPLSASYSKSAVFPFEAKHVTPDGRPLVIEDIGHLRRVEREYGVMFSAFSREPSRWNDTAQDSRAESLPKYRGEELRSRRA